MDARKTLGKNLAKAIKQKGYKTLELFAHENGFNKSWIARVVRGAVDPGFTRIVRVARSLGVTLDELYPMKRGKK